MVKIKRDDFSKKTRQLLAWRAGFHCAFTQCFQLCAGPSDESPTGVTAIGVAAHIRAAAPGGPRYDNSLSPAQRSHITNGIWLCANHARLIDTDTVGYTPAVLRQMKRDHEAVIDADVRLGSSRRMAPSDLIAIGPDVICTGRYLEIGHSSWTVELDHFVVGDPYALTSFIDGFSEAFDFDRYIVVNEIGDGRALLAAPVLSRTNGQTVVRCRVAPSCERIEVLGLGVDWARVPTIGDTSDRRWKWVEVSGLEALPHRLRSSLSLLPGESPFHPKAGARSVEYFGQFGGSPWFEQLLKLEVIRLSSIPYPDPVLRHSYPLLLCIARVREIRILAEMPTDRWLHVAADLDVNGVGRWSCDFSVLVET
jgi:hypothetical protein